MGRETKIAAQRGSRAAQPRRSVPGGLRPIGPECLASRLSIMESIVLRAQQTADVLEDDRPEKF